MNNDTNRSSGNFFSGFMIGALIGATVVFLLGTKKGKKILKAISEEGLDNISNIIEKVDKEINLDEVYEEEKNVIPKKQAVLEETIEQKPKTKRFFRGISRHLN